MREWLDRVAKTYFERIVGNLDEIFLFIGVDTTIYYANPAYSRLIGVPREKVIGRKLRDIEPQARIIKVLETERPVFHDYSYVASAGMDVIGNMFPVSVDGEKVGAIAIFRPITLDIAPNDRRRPPEDLEDDFFRDLVGESRAFRTVLRVVRKVAGTDATVLLRGETGVGKELLARAVHRASSFRSGPFVAVNMASMPETLLESELFGYEPGAFTGASRRGKPGLFEQANGGTLFLDEIGDMSPMLQAKLLRVLQEKQIRRLGGTRSVPVEIRLVAATNRDLEAMVEHGDFRSDLYYRVSVIPIYIPPLRERDQDVLLLAEWFKNRLEAKYGTKKAFSPRVLERFLQYSWPGNVRELQTCVEHMFVMADGVLLDIQHLPPPMAAGWTGRGHGFPGARPGPEKPRVSERLQSAPAEVPLRRRLEEMEREVLIHALRESRTKTEAMQKVGLSRKGFYAKLKKYGLLQGG